MRYKTLVLQKLEQADAIVNRLQFETNRGYTQDQLEVSIEQLKLQLEEIRSMVSIEHDSFEQQFR